MKPFKKVVNLYQMATFEILILSLNTCVLVLAIMDNQGEEEIDTRELIGDVIININLAFSGFAMFYIVLKIALAARKAYKSSTSKTNKSHNGWF